MYIITIAIPGKNYAMGETPVTFEQYDVFCKATKRKSPDDQGLGRGDRPVINVTGHDAVDFCEWLSEKTGNTYRLPTEEEWKYSARACARIRIEADKPFNDVGFRVLRDERK